MEFLKYKIEKARPNIKENSLKAYLISLKKLNQYMTDGEEFKNLDFLQDEDKVLEFLSTSFKLTTQKNYLSAIIVALDAFDDKYEDELNDYKDRLNELTDKYNEEIQKNEKNEKQEENWLSLKEMRKIISSYKQDLSERGAFKKETLTPKEKDLLQRWVVGNLYINDDNPPVRLDYGNMRVITNSDYQKLGEKDLKDNYLVVKSRNHKYFSFGNYKTERTYSLKEIHVGKKLNSVLNIWLRYNKSGALLVNARGKPMNSNQLGKFITKTFSPSGKQITVNLLRHIFISEKFPAEKEKEKNAVADKMMHSKDTQGTYAKTD